MGKPKMWNISKIANRRAQTDKIWDSGYYSAHIGVVFMPECLSLVWGHSVHFTKFLILQFETLLLQQFSAEINQTSYKVS